MRPKNKKLEKSTFPGSNTYIYILQHMLYLFGLLLSFSAFAHSMQESFAKSGTSGYVPSEYHSRTRDPADVYALTSYRNSGVRQTPNTAPVQPQMQRQPIQYQQGQQYESYQNQYTTYNPMGQQGHRGQAPNPYAGMERWQGSGQHNQTHAGRTPSPLMFKRYYNIAFAHPVQSSYKYSSSDGVSRSVTQSSAIPLVDTNGMLSFLVGTRFGGIPNLKREVGLQWELLSFKENLPSNPSSKVYHHNINISGKLLYDIPISMTSYISLGGELNYGLINHIVADDEAITFGFSYGILGGWVKQISPQRAFYVMLRQGVMQRKEYSVVNVSRDASISSTSIMVGLHLISG